MIHKYQIEKDYLTIQQYLESYFLGKEKIKQLFLNNCVFLNQESARKNMPLTKGDVLTLELKEELDFLPDAKKLDILYEDEYILAVNKPCHILVHPDDKSVRGTMANIVAYYYLNRGWTYPVRYAHRLDMDTTGVLLFAKDPLCLAKLDHMISTHELSRCYLCLALGKFKEKKGTIDAPIGEDRHHQQRKRISKTGKRAITHYEVLQEYKGYSLVRVYLETGRTHQIRVHLASLGHPILGDTLYGKADERFPRVLLHSYEATFFHPVTGKKLIIKKDLPFDMRKWIKK